MGNLLTGTLGKVLTEGVGKVLTELLGNVLTELLGKVLDIYTDRLQDIYRLFGQIPDVLEDVWIAVALGEKDRARKIIDVLPRVHPFEIRYTKVEKVNWETCRSVLDGTAKMSILTSHW